MSRENSAAELSGALARLARERADAVLCVAAEGSTARTGLAVGNGEVITVARQADDGETVTLVGSDGNSRGATVAGFDERSGIVLLRADGESGAGTAGFDVRSDAPAVGELTIAVARPSPDGPEARLGMIRFVSRPLETNGEGDRFFQTDASLFPGFAGAPVFDMLGKLLGITAPAGYREAAYVIPAADALEVVRRLREHGSPKIAYLGIRTTIAEIPAEAGAPGEHASSGEPETGLVVVALEEGSPAMQAGLLPGDIIVRLAGHRLHDHADLMEVLAGLPEGREAEAEIIRGGRRERISVTPGSRRESAGERRRRGYGRHGGYECGR